MVGGVLFATNNIAQKLSTQITGTFSAATSRQPLMTLLMVASPDLTSGRWYSKKTFATA
jgi:hypothetical protein